jgi:purine-nucleoside phosphorylase
MNAIHLSTQVNAAADEIRRRWQCRPSVGVILGTGQGGFAKEIKKEVIIPYEEIPHFVRSTALGHKGQLVCGRVADIPIVAMEGRFHLYEGYSPHEVTFPIRTMNGLGVQLLIITNAAGGLRPNFAPGDIVVIEDHINLMAGDPMTGANELCLGTRLPGLGRLYDEVLVRQALRIARQNNFVAYKGVYVGMSGPNYETRAEYQFLRLIGGDVVGMSTVPEATVAARVGIPVLALSVVTNVCDADAASKTDGESVIAAARSAEDKIRAIALGVIAEVFAAGRDRKTVYDSSQSMRAPRFVE